MQPRDRLTAKEIQVATLVWQGLTNKDIARVLLTSEQVVKNYLRTAFDKLGVWTRLELALYVASHGGANWHVQLGNGLLPPGAGWSVAAGGEAQFSGSSGISSTISSAVSSAVSSTISSTIKEKRSASGGQF
jgi:DNA-binding CsgD family transcriptional regulator